MGEKTNRGTNKEQYIPSPKKRNILSMQSRERIPRVS